MENLQGRGNKHPCLRGPRELLYLYFLLCRRGTRESEKRNIDFASYTFLQRASATFMFVSSIALRDLPVSGDSATITKYSRRQYSVVVIRSNRTTSSGGQVPEPGLGVRDLSIQKNCFLGCVWN